MPGGGTLNEDKADGYDPWTLAVAGEFGRDGLTLLHELPLDGMALEAQQGSDSLWLVARWPNGGGLAFRTAYAPGTGLHLTQTRQYEEAIVFDFASPVGQYSVRVETPLRDKALLHWTVTLTPAADLLLPFWPSDVYPLDAQGDPTRTRGELHAGQSGKAAGFLYLTLTQPHAGSALYLQDLTALNDLCEKTGTTPESRVGGLWPQMGYSPQPNDKKPLPVGLPTVISDAWVRLSPDVPQNDREAAGLFLDLLADLYPFTSPPETVFHDWPGRAQRSLRDLAETPDVTTTEMGHLYLRPYVGAETPDSMTQLTVLLALLDWQDWTEKPVKLADRLRAGVPDFFDSKLGAVRRYLPTVGEDKDRNAVDAWYLYHPLINLARLAQRGDEEAKRLFADTLDYGIKVAKHFKYQWPVMFHMETLDVITGPRKEGEPGQSDVGGLYAYVMLQAWDLFGEGRYLDEAKRAVRSLSGYQFAVAYQMNLTAWGANACLRLWKITGDDFYHDQGDVLLASYFHHTCLWNSTLGFAKHFPIFFGALCLHDGPYMALYECYEVYAAFHEYLALAGNAVRPSLRLLMTESAKYALSRAWSYYPDALPAAALASEVRNGRLDRTLSLPLEDLYPDGQPAGQVGQEVYGAGAAFAFATRSCHRLPDAPFLVYSEYPLSDLVQTPDHCAAFSLRGDSGHTSRLRLIPTGTAKLPKAQLAISGAVPSEGELTPEGHREWKVAGGSQVEVRW